MGKIETVMDFIFLGSSITADSDYTHEIIRHVLLGRKAVTNLDSVLKSRGITLPNKGPYIQSYGFSSQVRMWELNHKEGWMPKNWCFPAMVLEKTLESPLNSKEIKPVNPKGNQPWMFTERTDAESEAPILWSPDANSQLFGKDLDAGKDWGQREKREKENEMVGWHHWISEHESEQTPGGSKGQGSLVCCSPWRVRYDLVTKWLLSLKSILQMWHTIY